jgi:hypothetical protein
MKRYSAVIILVCALLAPAATAEAAPYLGIREAKTAVRSYLSDPHWWRPGLNSVARFNCSREARNVVRCAPCVYDSFVNPWRAQARVTKVYGPPGRTRWTAVWGARHMLTCP